jgi:LuxR family transcriptional regulator, quorum-sensing system regulator SolR
MDGSRTSCLEVALHSAKSYLEVFEQVTRIASVFDFEYCAYVIQAPIPISRPAVELFSNCPARQPRCASQVYTALDSILRWAFASSAPIVWNDDAADEAPTFWDAARASGFRYGWAMPCRDHRGAVGLLAFARSDEPISDTELDAKCADFTWITQHIHISMAEHWLPHHVPELDACITPREQEVLRWAAEGKTSCETAQIMNLSERTVNFHINNAVAKLGATNRIQAAVKAAMLGKLFLGSSPPDAAAAAEMPSRPFPVISSRGNPNLADASYRTGG